MATSLFSPDEFKISQERYLQIQRAKTYFIALDKFQAQLLILSHKAIGPIYASETCTSGLATLQTQNKQIMSGLKTSSHIKQLNTLKKLLRQTQLNNQKIGNSFKQSNRAIRFYCWFDLCWQQWADKFARKRGYLF